MAKSPLISIIIPVHNTEDYLNDCIKSVVSQKHDKLEIIIVDDDSNDKSKKIIKDWQKKDKRIKYLTTKKHNAALSRKIGVDNAVADYVCFVDSDDIIHERYIEKLYEVLVRTGTDMTVCKIATFAQEKEIERIKQGSGKIWVEEDELAHFFNHYDWISGGDFIPQSINAKIFKKELLKKIDYSVIKTSILEDNFTAIQIIKNLNKHKIGMIDNVLYYYRLHTNSTMATVYTGLIEYEDKKITFPELFEITMDYIKEQYAHHSNIDEYIKDAKVRRYYALAEAVVEKSIQVQNLTTQNEELIQRQKKHDDELSKLAETYQTRVADIKVSNSYKIGRLITLPIRFLKNTIQRV